jgi:hypothetical protein
MTPGSFLSAYISVHLRLLFSVPLPPFCGHSDCLSSLCVFACSYSPGDGLDQPPFTFHLSPVTSHPIPPAAGRQGLAEAVTGAASGVPGSVLTDN